MPESNNISTEEFFKDNQEIINPPSEFDGYEIINEERENLLNICMLLSNNSANLNKIRFDDKYEFVDSLVESGFATSDLEQQYNLAEIVEEINKIIYNLNYDINLSVEDVLSRDCEKAKYVREYCEYLPYYDLNMCAKIIEEQGYELFQVFLDCGGYTMSILQKHKMFELENFFE